MTQEARPWEVYRAVDGWAVIEKGPGSGAAICNTGSDDEWASLLVRSVVDEHNAALRAVKDAQRERLGKRWREDVFPDVRAMVIDELDRESTESEDVTNGFQIARQLLFAMSEPIRKAGGKA